MISDLLILREDTRDDTPFIISSWLRSYRLSPDVRDLEKDMYFREHQHVVENLLSRCSVYVLASSSDENTIVGWSATDGKTIHYVYIKQDFRRMGLAKKLLGGFEHWKSYSHRTILSSKINLPKTLEYNPYLAFY